MHKLKPYAIEMREAGHSYSAINKKLGISLSTLSSWFRDKPFSPNEETIQRITEGRLKYGRERSEERLRSVAVIND